MRGAGARHRRGAPGRSSAVGTTLEIMLNGQRREVSEPMTIAQLLGELGLKPEYVAVEVNRDLVSRSRHAARAGCAGRRPGDRHPGRRRVREPGGGGRGPALDRHAHGPQPAASSGPASTRRSS